MERKETNESREVKRISAELDSLVGSMGGSTGRRLQIARRFSQILADRQGSLTPEQLARVEKSGMFSVSQMRPDSTSAKGREFTKRVRGK